MTEPSRPFAVARYLRAVVGTNPDGPTDAELLARFAANRDQGAFELLVWRHAGMVTAVCRNILRDHHAAEDATQAAFLALARKAGTVRENPAGWLFRVASRIALRSQRTRTLIPIPSHESHPNAAEATGILHEELARLPEKYRVPILLCFFEGLSHADAAKRLGWPTGTVAGRIARAKDVLQSRLVRRGVTTPTVGLTALFSTEGIGGAFAAATARAAVDFAIGGIVADVTPSILCAANGALKAMTISKLQMAFTVMLACATVTTGSLWAVGQSAGGGIQAGGAGSANSPPQASGSGSAAAGLGEAWQGTVVDRIKVDAKAPTPGKPEDPKRIADFAQRVRSKENLKNLVLALHNHHDATGHFPQDIVDEKGKPLLSWRVQLLPYLEQAHIYNRLKLNEPWDSEHNKKFLVNMPDVFRTGFQDKAASDTYYQAFTGIGTAFNEPGKKIKLIGIIDGTSNTLGIAEVGPAVPWMKPGDVPYHPGKAFPNVTWPFANAIQFATMDGDFRVVKPEIGELILRRLIERDDGNPSPDFKALRPSFPAEAAEEKAMLARTLDANAALLAEIDDAMKELAALHKLKNSHTTDVEKARDLTLEFKRLLEGVKPRIKKERDELGIPRGAKIPEPKELPKP